VDLQPLALRPGEEALHRVDRPLGRQLDPHVGVAQLVDEHLEGLRDREAPVARVERDRDVLRILGEGLELAELAARATLIKLLADLDLR